MFTKPRENTLKPKHSKCEFGLPYIEYLGHIISQGGVSVVPSKTRAISECKPPENIKYL